MAHSSYGSAAVTDSSPDLHPIATDDEPSVRANGIQVAVAPLARSEEWLQ